MSKCVIYIVWERERERERKREREREYIMNKKVRKIEKMNRPNSSGTCMYLHVHKRV